MSMFSADNPPATAGGFRLRAQCGRDISQLVRPNFFLRTFLATVNTPAPPNRFRITGGGFLDVAPFAFGNLTHRAFGYPCARSSFANATCPPPLFSSLT